MEEQVVGWRSENMFRFRDSYMPCLVKLKGVEVNEEKSPRGEKTKQMIKVREGVRGFINSLFLSLCIF